MKQHTVQEANESRLVTKVRSIVFGFNVLHNQLLGGIVNAKQGLELLDVVRILQQLFGI